MGEGSAPQVLPLPVCGYVCAEIMQAVRVKNWALWFKPILQI